MMRNCENCIHNYMCKDMIKYGICAMPYENNVMCGYFKAKSNDFAMLDKITNETIINVKDNWLMLNIENEHLGEAIKRCVEYLIKNKKAGE